MAQNLREEIPTFHYFILEVDLPKSMLDNMSPNLQTTIIENGAYNFSRHTQLNYSVPTAIVTVENRPYILITTAIQEGEYHKIDTSNSVTTSSTDTPLVAKPKIEWSSIRSKRVNFIKDYLTTQIRVRYAMFDRPTNGLSNVILDSFIPRLLVANKLNVKEAQRTANFPSTAVTLSPWFSEMFGVKQMPFEQMIRFLGYDKKQLKSILQKVKAKNWHITFIGYGGTNVNTIHWLKELCHLTNMVGVLKYVEVYEDDSLEISNLLRFPKNPSAHISKNNTSKLVLLNGDLEAISKIKPYTFRKFYQPNVSSYNTPHYFLKHTIMYEPLTDDQLEQEKKGYYVSRKRLQDDNGFTIYETTHNPNYNHVFYGAPNIETREQLSEIGNFISATHGSNDCSLHLNPTQDTGLQVESYGMIQLASFFMNQLQMAISFMETLADPSFDPTEKNKELMSFQFDGISKKPCDRTYQFQLNFAGNMLDEHDAANLQG